MAQCRKAITVSSAQKLGLGANAVQVEASNLIQQLFGVRSVGRGSVMCAMSGNPSQTAGSNTSPVRTGEVFERRQRGLISPREQPGQWRRAPDVPA